MLVHTRIPYNARKIHYKQFLEVRHFTPGGSVGMPNVFRQ